MYVAVDDFTIAGGDANVEKILQVPDPCTASFQQDGSGLVRKDDQDVIQVVTGRSYTTAELQRRNRELAKANLIIQSKDKEIRDLRQFLTDTQRRIDKLSAERRDYRQKLQEKDIRINSAYESLLNVSKERAELREELFEMEQELLDVYSTQSITETSPDLEQLDTTDDDSEQASVAPSDNSGGDEVASVSLENVELIKSRNDLTNGNESLEDALSKRMHRLNLLSWKLLNDAQDDEDQITQH